MNPTLFAALCGFIFRELLAIEGRQDKSTPFKLRYYLRNNAMVIALNTVGTIGLYFTIPDLMRLQSRYLDGHDYPMITGLVIGLLGAWLVRWLQDTVKAKVQGDKE
jgi:hypothetical protein